MEGCFVGFSSFLVVTDFYYLVNVLQYDMSCLVRWESHLSVVEEVKSVLLIYVLILTTWKRL